MQKIKGFSASRVGSLLAQGTGKTRQNYIFELAENHIGIKSDLLTKAMSHGIQNEVYAMSILTSVVGGEINDDGFGNQISYPVNDYLSATPDGKGEGFTMDAKCNYYIHTFFEQKDKLPLGYHYQIQTQMMALKVDKGYLINYLTKPEMFGQDDWEEYPIPLDLRYHIHELTKDDAVHDSILSHAEKYYPLIGQCVDMIGGATILNHDHFFGMQFHDKVRFNKLKDVNWITNDKEVFRYDNVFYVKK